MSRTPDREDDDKNVAGEDPALQPLLPATENDHDTHTAHAYVTQSGFKRLSATDKKTLLLTTTMDKMGMGRYSWYIFFLCGYGYALDLMWAQAFGLIVSSAQQEFGIPDSQFGTLLTAFNVGLTIGAFTWGIIGDMFGRKWAFNLTVLITGFWGMLLGSAPSWPWLCFLSVFTGFGIGGNIPTDASIVHEFLPHDSKYLLAALSLFQPLGVVVCSVIAWGFIPSNSCETGLRSCYIADPGEQCCAREDNVGWRFTTNAIGAITLFCFFLRFVVFNFQESPKFLLLQGREQEAVDVIQHIAKVNRKPCSLTVEDIYALDGDDISESSSTRSGEPKTLGEMASQFKVFFSTPYMARLSLAIWATFIFDYAAFSIAGGFLPDILRRKGVAAGQSVDITYRNYIIIYAPGIVGVVLGAFVIQTKMLGKTWSMTISASLMAASLFAFVYIDSPAANVGFNAMEYFFQSMFNAILYGYTPEAFPAAVRGSACGIASTWGRLSSIVAPLVATRLLATSVDGVLYLAGGAAVLSAIVTLFLPEKLKNEGF
ncbi:MFS general substrate transporter [Gloeophyllum trabeum ATCC 11539]|uniref:MFS general substrate transporter n=1 Tax=Gloeophyllum trabeum (strain ATCC 11539 / FP-39264 / Madison 617) TaxID=670483 RepID=S7RQ25_GLOTA|nr:MFS general substrate transporter [Gloeophyllum trabeum ATCC 11539]EPQ56690.1 MFS general substrate transporter [Gloeophyllum trabeum ATCC 11539]